jgi:hypothetical protein
MQHGAYTCLTGFVSTVTSSDLHTAHSLLPHGYLEPLIEISMHGSRVSTVDGLAVRKDATGMGRYLTSSESDTHKVDHCATLGSFSE